MRLENFEKKLGIISLVSSLGPKWNSQKGVEEEGKGRIEEECSREEKKKHTMWSLSVVHLTGMIAIKI